MSFAKQNRKVVQVTIFFCFDQNIGPNVAKKAPICQEFDGKTVDEKKNWLNIMCFSLILRHKSLKMLKN